MARRKKQEDFLGTLVVVLMGVAFFWGFSVTQSFAVGGIAAGIVFGVSFALLLIRRQIVQERLKRSGIFEIDNMDGRQFEHYLGILYRSRGYTVEVTKASGDYGADLVVKKDGRKTVVQAKRYAKNVGIKAVQEAQAAIAFYKADDAIVISNRDYTTAAKNLASANQVKLINRQGLIEMMLEINPNGNTEAKQVRETVAPLCERCRVPMIKRSGPKGSFYGCSNYPSCKNTKAV